MIIKVEHTHQKTDEKRTVNASKTRRDPNNNDNNDNNDNKNIPAEKSAVTLHSLCKNLFLEKYRTMYKEEYYWDAKSGANLKHIINKIKFNRNAKGMNVDDDSLLSAFGFFWIVSTIIGYCRISVFLT